MNATPQVSEAERKLLNIPNVLSLARLALTPVGLWLITTQWYMPAFFTFVIAAATDWFDGYIARRLGQTSAFGRQLDPLVDKVMTAGFFIYLLPLPDSGLAPWMVTVIVARELVIQWLRSLMEGQGVAFGASMSGKLKTTFQLLAIGAILVGLWRPEQLDGPLRLARDLLIWAAVLLTIYSGVVYIVGAIPRLKRTIA